MTRPELVVALSLSVSATGIPAGQDHPHASDASRGVTVMTGLGSHHHRISTRSPLAQRLFDQGLVLLYPVRETLGAALLASGRAAEAEQVFRQDLKDNPGNGRSLFGVWQAIAAQGHTAAAARARAEFSRVWAVADVRLRLEHL